MDKASVIKNAQRYLERGQIDKAISEWERLIDEYHDGNILNTIGDLYLKKGDKNNAISFFHRAAEFFKEQGFSLKALGLYKKILNVDPANADALLSLGKINEERGLKRDAIKYYLTAADSLSRESEKERLFEIYERILSISPLDLFLRKKVADLYAKEGLSSKSAKEYFHIARYHEEKGDIEEALEYYKKVLDIEPLNKEAILSINYLFEKQGNLERAIEHMKEANVLFPEDTEISLRYAEIYTVWGKFDEAKERLKKILEIEPVNVKAKKLLGEIYVKEGDRDKAWAEYLPVVDEIISDMKTSDAIALVESFKDISPLETGKRLVSLYRQTGEDDKVAHELVVLGNTLTSMGRQREAFNCYKEALSIIPDDEVLRSRVVELVKELSMADLSKTDEEAVDEALADAEILIRYGLCEEAKNLLEGLSQSEPGNIDLHLKLRSLFINAGDKEQAVTECLLLSELFGRADDIENKEHMIEEALEIDPEDPRLVGLRMSLGKVSIESPEGHSIEDYSEEIAEADFYSKQGLVEEAKGILGRLHKLFPLNEEIRQKLLSLNYEFEREKIDSDVLGIFNEFKRGLEQQLEKEDSETHYNLGIAYKEMGLIDDAIREFRIALGDPNRFIQSSSMIAACYSEKGQYQLAADILIDALKKVKERDESYWSMKYDLAGIHEKGGNLEGALNCYREIYEWNSRFRDIPEKIIQIKERLAGVVQEEKPRAKKDRISYL
ncbi:MAG: tetratricopeptide repeat protein [Nitrospirota bacterium]